MKLKIIGPGDTGLSGYDVWLESGEDWHSGGVLLGSGPSKVDALSVGQRELARIVMQMSELVWQSRQKPAA